MPQAKKKVAIVQSNYIPWKGYFDMINSVDEFILFDDMQYTKRDWRNRNKIKTSNGPKWLTIPVEVKGKYYQKIKDTIVVDQSWRKNHWVTIKYQYSKAKYFDIYRDVFEKLYVGNSNKYLSQINYAFIQGICNLLSIKTTLKFSMDYNLIEGKTKRLIDLCKQAGAYEYHAGPLSKNYIVEEFFEKEGIKLVYLNYEGYREYHQLFPPFDHYVSILDLIFNEGPNSKKYMKSF